MVVLVQNVVYKNRIKILMNLFYPLLISPNFLNISSEFTKRLLKKKMNELINNLNV